MKINKIQLVNFKKFYGKNEICFNDKINIIIGDNETGKSTILQAIDIVCNGSRTKVENIGLNNLFNERIINEFLESDRKKFPIMEIDLFLNEDNIERLNGKNYYEPSCTQNGLRLICEADMENYSNEIKEILEDDNCVFPFEFYKVSFTTFADQHYNGYNKFVSSLFINNLDNNNDSAMQNYISNIYNKKIELKERNSNNIAYRKIKKDFQNTILNNSNKEIKFGLSNSKKLDLENNLTIIENEKDIQKMGTGKQILTKVQLSLNKGTLPVDIILIEEPENHLSFLNMKKMINYISSNDNSQVFITTHSDMITSKLGLNNLIILSEKKVFSLKNIDNEIVKYFMKTPNNNILTFILSSKVILVEGAAEFILMNKFFSQINAGKMDNYLINCISINSLSFKRYIAVGKELENKIAIITDNDGDYEKNIKNKYESLENDKIRVFSEKDNKITTFEIALYQKNKEMLEKIKMNENYMLNNKTESAFKILCSDDNFVVPNYIKEALEWIKN